MERLIGLQVEVRGLPGPMVVSVCGCRRSDADRVLKVPGPGRLAVDVLALLELRKPGDRFLEPEAAALQIARFYQQAGARRVLIVRQSAPPAAEEATCQSCSERPGKQHVWIKTCPSFDDPEYRAHPAIEAGESVFWQCKYCAAWKPYKWRR